MRRASSWAVPCLATDPIWENGGEGLKVLLVVLARTTATLSLFPDGAGIPIGVTVLLNTIIIVVIVVLIAMVISVVKIVPSVLAFFVSVPAIFILVVVRLAFMVTTLATIVSVVKTRIVTVFVYSP